MGKSAIPKIYLYKQIVEAKLFIDAHYKEKISLEDIASQACFSKFHFHRTFKECYHKTPLEYLTYLRIKKAKELLCLQHATKDVCDEVGYESVSWFCKLFKRIEGVTPAEYSYTESKQKLESKSQPLNYIPNGYAEYLGWNHE